MILSFPSTPEQRHQLHADNYRRALLHKQLVRENLRACNPRHQELYRQACEYLEETRGRVVQCT